MKSKMALILLVTSFLLLTIVIPPSHTKVMGIIMSRQETMGACEESLVLNKYLISRPAYRSRSFFDLNKKIYQTIIYCKFIHTSLN